jgi:hypothetical protein
LAPDGKSTLLRDALQKITSRYAGMNVAGGLVLTDGVDTREAFEDWSGEPRPFPLYTVALEPDAVWDIEPDIHVDMVRTPRRVTVDWKTELKAVISGQGTKGDVIGVRLYKDNVMEQEVPTQVPEDGGSRQATFEITHTEVGVFTYRVYVPPLPGETNTNDNEFAVSVQVIDAKNRLIYIEGAPRWESKYLKRALQANKMVSPLMFVRGPDGKPRAFGPAGSMTPDLTENQLSYFKVVVIGNLTAKELGTRRAENLIEYVEDGGSLVLLGGTQAWSQDGFASSPLKKIMPVKSWRPNKIEGEFSVALTDTGLAHPAFAGDQELWDVIPPVLSVFPGVQLAAAGQALVSAQTPAGEENLVVSQRYGQGKVVAIFTDSLWKWKLHPRAIENRPYQRFWDQLIAWMLPDEEDLDKDRLELFADRETLVLGEEITINARLGGENRDKKISVRCEIELPDKNLAPFSMRPETVTTSSGKSYPGYATVYTVNQPGLHTITATALVEGNRVKSDALSFFVKPYSPETIPRAMHAGVLKNIAQGSGGAYFESLDALNEALSQLTYRQIEEELSEYNTLWQKPAILGLLMALVTIGWIARKLNSMP